MRIRLKRQTPALHPRAAAPICAVDLHRTVCSLLARTAAPALHGCPRGARLPFSEAAQSYGPQISRRRSPSSPPSREASSSLVSHAKSSLRATSTAPSTTVIFQKKVVRPPLSKWAKGALPSWCTRRSPPQLADTADESESRMTDVEEASGTYAA
eukprot:197558-Pleurochrysis_carterae.AAC.1